MHLKRGRVNQESRPDEFVVLCMIAQHMAHVLTQVALDTFAKLLNAVNIRLLHSPCAVRCVRLSGLELLDPFLDLVIPRDVGDQILDGRKGTYRLYRHGLRDIDRVEPRHAHQLWHAVDLSRARTALARLTVPPAREIRRRLGLYLMHGIEHDHTLRHLSLIVDHLAALTAAASYAESSFCHKKTNHR